MRLPRPARAGEGPNDRGGLLPALQGKAFAGRTAQYYNYSNDRRALRKGPYKLTGYLVKGTRHTQLFNLDMDPRETWNIAGAKICVRLSGKCMQVCNDDMSKLLIRCPYFMKRIPQSKKNVVPGPIK